MKALSLLLVCIVLGSFVGGCGSSEPEPTPAPVPDKPLNAPEGVKPTAPMGQSPE